MSSARRAAADTKSVRAAVHNVQFDPRASARFESARLAFRAKRDAGALTADDIQQFTEEIRSFSDAMGWGTRQVRKALREGRYRAPGFVIEDEVGYDRELARRSVGPGWASLVGEIFDFRDAHCPHARVVQVKEKFGALTVYLEGPHACLGVLSDFVAEVERRSETICERCGAPGLTRAGAWIQTLCRVHSEGRPPLAESAR
jgi:hypothetical protein